MREEFNAIKASGRTKKDAIGKVQELREADRTGQPQVENGPAKHDLKKAGELKYSQPAQPSKAAGGKEEQIGRPGQAASCWQRGPRRGDRPHRNAGPASLCPA